MADWSFPHNKPETTKDQLDDIEKKLDIIIKILHSQEEAQHKAIKNMTSWVKAK